MAASTVSWWSSSPFLANKSVNPSKRSVPRSVSFPAKKCGEFRPLVRAMAGGENTRPKIVPLGAISMPDIIVNEKEIKIGVDFSTSGFEKKDVNTFEVEGGDVLIIKGEHNNQTGDAEGSYRIGKSLRFSLQIPKNCDIQARDVKFENGALNITIPKKPEEHKIIDIPFQ